jgi:hypothetical protein
VVLGGGGAGWENLGSARAVEGALSRGRGGGLGRWKQARRYAGKAGEETECVEGVTGRGNVGIEDLTGGFVHFGAISGSCKGGGA